MHKIGYIRVSTKEQGVSGLGLAAQQETIRRLAGDDLVKIFCDVASGSDDERPELARALAMAQHLGGKVVVAKLDRLARSVSKIKSLLDAGHHLVFGDIPESQGASGDLHVTIMAAMAEFERQRGCERTREGLAAARARGVRLGAPDGGKRLVEWIKTNGNSHAHDACKANATARAEKHRTALETAVGEGMSAKGIARVFNARKVPTARNGRWTATSVLNTLRRLDLAV